MTRTYRVSAAGLRVLRALKNGARVSVRATTARAHFEHVDASFNVRRDTMDRLLEHGMVIFERQPPVGTGNGWDKAVLTDTGRVAIGVADRTKESAK